MNAYNKLIILSGILLSLLISCSKNFLDVKPLGSTSETTLASKAGVEGLLIGAYSMLDGIGGGPAGGSPYSQAVSNWVFGGVASDDAHKGSTDDDQSDVAEIEKYAVNSSNN